MDVKDPQGPVAVGDEATYEVRVRNRGTKEAEGVEVFAYFSRGIEPTGAEGGPNRLGPGQVDVPAHPLAGPRRRSGAQGPRPSRGCRKPHLPGGSPLPAAGRTADQRGHQCIESLPK